MKWIAFAIMFAAVTVSGTIAYKAHLDAAAVRDRATQEESVEREKIMREAIRDAERRCAEQSRGASGLSADNPFEDEHIACDEARELRRDAAD